MSNVDFGGNYKLVVFPSVRTNMGCEFYLRFLCNELGSISASFLLCKM